MNVPLSATTQSHFHSLHLISLPLPGFIPNSSRTANYMVLLYKIMCADNMDSRWRWSFKQPHHEAKVLIPFANDLFCLHLKYFFPQIVPYDPETVKMAGSAKVWPKGLNAFTPYGLVY